MSKIKITVKGSKVLISGAGFQIVKGAVELGEAGNPARSGLARIRAAALFLIERFREKREWNSDDMMTAARNENVSRSSLFDAKKALSLPPCRKVTNAAGNTCWVWWVPEDWIYLSDDLVGNYTVTESLPQE